MHMQIIAWDIAADHTGLFAEFLLTRMAPAAPAMFFDLAPTTPSLKASMATTHLPHQSGTFTSSLRLGLDSVAPELLLWAASTCTAPHSVHVYAFDLLSKLQTAAGLAV